MAGARADSLRTATRVALGLWPMPTKTPARAVIHGKRELDGYTIEKVYLESFPGFFVTGNLYRPSKSTGRCPGVLCPHGHFTNGRFGARDRDELRRLIVAGAERFEDGGRSSIQARCVQLARMGCVVFNYDMVGYCDCVQVSYDLAHRFAKQRPEMISSDRWGLFSPQAESHLQSVMGLQTYNSIRALDWLESLPDVDPERIAVTGASGGGTQTFLLCATRSPSRGGHSRSDGVHRDARWLYLRKRFAAPNSRRKCRLCRPVCTPSAVPDLGR